jgi:hypothetical protein
MAKIEIDKKIIEEIQRYSQINKYIVREQEELTADPVADLGAEEIPEPVTAGSPEPVDVATDPDVEVVGDEVESVDETGTEELDITDLVTSQKEIKDKQDEFMDVMFGKLEDLENKLQSMDAIFDKINSIENKIEKYREKTPEEKLHLRSLDSYPYNQKLTDFFVDKQKDMDATGKNEYVLTDDEVESFQPNEIKKSFNNYLQDDNKY